ncbi:hypothetical protein JHK87_030962 [Glycine soja]|nr:hypothetical protein JHK87_030962 [Glycine soja]
MDRVLGEVERSGEHLGCRNPKLQWLGPCTATFAIEPPSDSDRVPAAVYYTNLCVDCCTFNDYRAIISILRDFSIKSTSAASTSMSAFVRSCSGSSAVEEYLCDQFSFLNEQGLEELIEHQDLLFLSCFHPGTELDMKSSYAQFLLHNNLKQCIKLDSFTENSIPYYSDFTEHDQNKITGKTIQNNGY